jgi:hypothetical protein
MRPTIELRDHWLELRGGMIALLETLTSSLDVKSSEMVRDFVENREFGVALGWLHSIVLERHISLSADQSEKFGKLATLMSIELSGPK